MLGDGSRLDRAVRSSTTDSSAAMLAIVAVAAVTAAAPAVAVAPVVAPAPASVTGPNDADISLADALRALARVSGTRTGSTVDPLGAAELSLDCTPASGFDSGADDCTEPFAEANAACACDEEVVTAAVEADVEVVATTAAAAGVDEEAVITTAADADVDMEAVVTTADAAMEVVLAKATDVDKDGATLVFREVCASPDDSR